MPGGLLGTARPVPTVNERQYDADAARWIDSVSSADGQLLEQSVCVAVNQFVISCKAANIWNAIRICYLLCGARTLSGALVPLLGPAPTNSNFVSSDYDRKLGLSSSPNIKTLDTGRPQTLDRRDDFHICCYATRAVTSTFGNYFGVGAGTAGATHIGRLDATSLFVRNRSINNETFSNAATLTGFIGLFRNSSCSHETSVGNLSSRFLRTSQAQSADTTRVFSVTDGTSNATQFVGNARIAFFSLGNHVNRSGYKAIVDQLMTDIGSAI